MTAEQKPQPAEADMSRREWLVSDWCSAPALVHREYPRWLSTVQSAPPAPRRLSGGFPSLASRRKGQTKPRLPGHGTAWNDARKSKLRRRAMEGTVRSADSAALPLITTSLGKSEYSPARSASDHSQLSAQSLLHRRPNAMDGACLHQLVTAPIKNFLQLQRIRQ